MLAAVTAATCPAYVLAYPGSTVMWTVTPDDKGVESGYRTARSLHRLSYSPSCMCIDLYRILTCPLTSWNSFSPHIRVWESCNDGRKVP